MGWCCVLNDWFQAAKKGVEAGDPTIIGILIAVLIVILTILILSIRGGVNKRRAVLLVGLCDAGKTLLFGRLVYKKYVQSHTSINKNIGSYDLIENKSGSLQVVDFPGHERLRSQMDEYKGQARGIIFVVDSMTFQKELKDVAGYLYNLLTDRVILSNSPPVLIACNKQDQGRAKGSKVIQAQLEKEMNTVRMTQTATLEATDNTISTVYLGKQGKEFQFADLKNFKIEFAECSARGNKGDSGEADLGPVEEWLHKIA